jgi:hypothetical protein
MVIGSWLVIAATVLALLLIPYKAHYSFSVRVVRHGSDVRQRVDGSVQCRSPIVERLSDQAQKSNVQQALREGFRKAAITRSDLDNFDEQRVVTDLNAGAAEVRSACKGPATPRVLFAVGILAVALIGTWLFFNLMRDWAQRTRS